MKPVVLVFLLIIFGTMASCPAFAIGPGDYAPVIKKQAEQMGNALIKKDYKTYIKFLHPKVLADMGGEKNAVDTLKAAEKQMAKFRQSISYILVNESSWVIDTAGELQATVSETIELKVTGGRVRNDLTMIAISKDRGKNWVFIDTSNDTADGLHKQFPDLSKKLVIPPHSQPVYEGD